MACFFVVRLHLAFRVVSAIAMIGALNSAVFAAPVTFSTPGTWSWVVPANLTSITVVAIGGGGGGGWGAPGGYGGKVTSTLSVTPGQSLTINIGGGGIGSGKGGGGGGATSIDPGTAWQIVAGGGGGGGGKAGGDGNGSNGVDGTGASGTGGHGGSGGIGGAGGINVLRPTCTAAAAGGNGNGGPGGDGGSDSALVAAGAGGTGVGSGTGGGAAHQPGACAPGGGGGGYGGGGGGGGAGNDGGGGGGGSVGPAGSVVSVGTNRGAAHITGGNGSVTITYSDRSLSQAIDGSVRGTIAAQATSAIRFAETQIRNVTDHIHQIGSDFSLSGNRLAVGFDLYMPSASRQATQLLLAAADGKWSSAGLPIMTDADAPKYAGLDESATNNPKDVKNDKGQLSLSADERNVSGPRYAFWAAGDVSDGHMDVSSGTNKFYTDGITLGMDFMPNAKAIFGAAFGYGRDHTDIDSLGTRVGANQRSFTAYGVYEPRPGMLLDGLLGMGDLAMSNSRFSALSSAVLASDRKGHSTYSAIGLSYPMKIKAFSAKPYLRASYLDVTLDAYNEGSDVNALAFDRTKVKSTSVFAGLTVSYDTYTQDGGRWIPNAKFELRRNTKGSVDQSINFADTPGEKAILRLDSTPQNVQTLGLGMRYVQKRGVNIGLTWLGAVGSDSYRVSMAKVDLVVPF